MTSAPVRPTPAALAKYPVPVGLVTTLYRANDAEFAALTAPMPEYGRARIAAYCMERPNLHALALRIASTCAETALIRAAGTDLGAYLFAQSRPASTAEAPTPSPEPDRVAIQIIDIPASFHDREEPRRSEAA